MEPEKACKALVLPARLESRRERKTCTPRLQLGVAAKQLRRGKNPHLETDLEWVCGFDLTVSFYFGAFGEGGE